ncbi:MAG: exo-alpha-sialidase [Planctomycetaceae bacterium]|nr:exo-alpha-sialidase [Planctomycetaceae bacterium]
MSPQCLSSRLVREIAFGVLFLALTAAAAHGQEPIDVWTSGEGGYDTYRIPSLIKTKSGALLAICEGRKTGRGDSGNIDLLMRRSTDGGQTWSPTQVIWDDKENTCGNPCPVVDQETGTILLLSTHNLGIDREKEIIALTSKGTRTVWLLKSTDDGLSWSKPQEITQTAKKPDWTWYATGPGIGIQIQHGPHKGRLVIPCDHIEADTKDYYSHVIYSDDRGETWQLGGSTPEDQVNECEVVELADPPGRLMLNMRNYDRDNRTRQTAVSDDGGLTWQGQKHDPVLIEPICQASIRRLRWPTDARPGAILFSNPASQEGREKMTVRVSFDDAKTWSHSALVNEGFSAYSCLERLDDTAAGLLYEGAVGDKTYGRITFLRLGLDWLTDSK